MEVRDCCIRKDFSSPRNGKRIYVICNLIYELWVKYRQHNPTIGFYYITNAIELEGSKDGDPFYWEEDKWYDKIKEMIKKVEELQQNYELSWKDYIEMKSTISHFCDYWKLYPDLRLKQILNCFDELVETRIRENDILDKTKWDKIFIKEQIDVLQNKLVRYNKLLKEPELSGFYTEQIQQCLEDIKKEINSLVEEYESDGTKL